VLTGSCGAVLDAVRGFMFDVDGTLLHRGPDGRGQPQPGAVEVLARIRASGRKLVLFTNASHVPSATVARGLRDDGLPVADHEVLTPTDSAITFLGEHHAQARVLLFASDAVSDHMTQAGVIVANGEDADAVFVAHQDEVELSSIERAARAVRRGAPLFTSSYVAGYAGANGMIFSRGAMIAAAIAKVSGVRPRVLGKPSRAAVEALRARLGVPTRALAVVGDDLEMDIALGRMGGSQTILVRSGISGAVDLSRVPERRRPDAVIDGVADLLALL
jgi:HAD superfamily hydrolase (TIGR01450 family)